MRSVKLDRFTIDDNHPPIFMAEISTFFNQDIELAKSYMKQIKDSGADVVKGEVLHSADVCLNDDSITTYYSHKKGLVKENFRQLVERKVLSLEDYAKIFALYKDLDIPLVLSVYDFKGADFAVDIGAASLKIASPNVVHAPLIRYVAKALSKSGKPMFIDTAKSTVEEIAHAVQWARDAGCEDIIVEHSPDRAPAPLEDHNLRILQMLKTVFDIPVGLSCHHSGDEMLYAAVALGANVIEKGVCEDPTEPEQDFYWVMPISELKTAVQKCRNIYAALGNYMRRMPSPHKRPTARMGLVAKKDIEPGDILNFDTVDFAFPAKGIEVERWDLVAGRPFAKSVKKGDVIRFEDIDFTKD